MAKGKTREERRYIWEEKKFPISIRPKDRKEKE